MYIHSYVVQLVILKKQCVNTYSRFPIFYPRMDHWPYKRMLKVHSPAIKAMSSVVCSWWTIHHLRPEHKGAFSKNLTKKK